ncbi:MAG: hypothetical protein ACE5IR_15980 [bacterium]
MGNDVRKTYRGLIQSRDADTSSLCEDIGRQLAMVVTCKEDVADFLVELQEKDHHVVIFDVEQAGREKLKWVKLIRRLRPKLPLIIICDQIDQNTEAKMHEEKIFYLGLRPLDREVLCSIIKAALGI